MKQSLIIFGILFSTMLLSAMPIATKTFHSFTVKDIDGETFNMASLKGKKVLVVNTASKCGLTPQYAQLQELYEKYGDKHFVVIAFPSNDFGAQEPGSNAEIKEFCKVTYDVTFPVMSKISVSGKDMAPIYKWLTQKSENGVVDAPIQWNFQKFMIDENGNVVGMVPPKEAPDCDTIVDWIEGNTK